MVVGAAELGIHSNIVVIFPASSAIATALQPRGGVDESSCINHYGDP